MSTDRGMDKKDEAHTYNGILLSHWKEWNNATCSNMDWPRDSHTELSQRRRNTLGHSLHVESKKKWCKGTFKIERDSQASRTNLWLPGGRMGGEGTWGVWDGHVHAAVFKMENQQGPTVWHRGLCSMLWGSLDGRGAWGEWIHVYLQLSPFPVHLKQIVPVHPSWCC